MNDPRVLDEIVGYVRYEVEALNKLVIDAMGAMAESLRQLDDKRLEIERRVSELTALQMRMRDAGGGLEDYAEHVCALLASRYAEASPAHAEREQVA